MISLGHNNLLKNELLSKVKNKVAVGLADNDNMVGIDETNYVQNQINGAVRFTMEKTKHPIESVDIKTLTEYIVKFCRI